MLVQPGVLGPDGSTLQPQDYAAVRVFKEVHGAGGYLVVLGRSYRASRRVGSGVSVLVRG